MTNTKHESLIILEPQIHIADDFDEECEEINALFYDGELFPPDDKDWLEKES